MVLRFFNKESVFDYYYDLVHHNVAIQYRRYIQFALRVGLSSNVQVVK